MERRRFSAALQGQNLRFTGAGEGGSARARVGFLMPRAKNTGGDVR